MQTNQFRILAHIHLLLSGSWSPRPCPPALSHPRACYWTTRDYPYSPDTSPLSSPNPAHMFILCYHPFLWKPHTSFCACSPLAPFCPWLTLVLPHVALHGMQCLLFVGICEYTILLGDSHFCVRVPRHTWFRRSFFNRKPRFKFQPYHLTCGGT